MTAKDAATIAALLGELREADFETWKDVKFLLSNMMLWQAPNKSPLEQNAYQDIIQGCIQRAISAIRGKDFLADCFFDLEMADKEQYEARIYDRTQLLAGETATSPTAAILAAYVAAKRAMR